MDIKTLVASGVVSAVVATSIPMLAGSVTLQAASPGTPDTGHSNVSGYSLAGRFGANASPTLARVQVNEPGPLQGVRANTASGTSVYGANSAATGLGAGGYFTSSSSGGRAVVGDALSTSGATAGGLFYNRSTSGGVALWGKHIGATGTTTGILGEVASGSGTALSATNSASGNSIVVGTGDDSLKSTGKLPRHQYTEVAAAPMVPIAYGSVTAAGATYNVGSGNWSMTLDGGSNTYTLDIDGVDFLSSTQFTVVATSLDAGDSETVTYEVASVGDILFSLFRNAAPGSKVQSFFSFVVYSALPVTAGPGSVPQIPAAYRHMPVEKWAKADPSGFEKWRKASVASQRQALESRKYAMPIDAPSKPE